MRWLHLSDLHFGYHTATVTAMRSKLLALAEKEGPVDCLFITGDLRFAKRSPTAYPEDTLPFLRKLQEALGVDGGSTFLVPGNHDVNRCEELTALPDEMTFGTTNVWRDSPIRKELNGTYFDSLATLKQFVKEVDILTAPNEGRTGDFITTQDKVFLLTSAEVNGMIQMNGPVPTDPREYTLGHQEVLFSNDDARKAKIEGASNYSAWWTRSPCQSVDGDVRAAVCNQNGSYGYYPISNSEGVRPAMWIAIK